MSGAASFDELVASRAGAWWRLAWLLTGESGRARELLDLALSRVWARHGDLDRAGGAEASVRRELVAAHLEAAGRSGRKRAPARADPDRHDPVVDVLGPERQSSLDDLRARVLAVLAVLAPNQRAAVVLSQLPDLPPWDAADALDVTVDRLAALGAEADAVAAAADSRGAELLRRAVDVVPDPPYDDALAARARVLASRHRRRRRLRAGAVAAVLAAVVAVPVLLSQDPATTTADGTATERDVAAAERLVDPLPIPDQCAELPTLPPPPDIPYDPDGADAVWLRFCPAPDLDGQLRAIPFAPQTTLVAQGVDDLVDRWTAAGARLVPCTRSFRPGEGTVRAQVGTLDGALHIVDMRVGACGSVSVDGQRVAVSGREAFADAVRLLGADQLEQVDNRGLVVPEPAYCPDEIEQLARFTRTTVPDYPQVPGLPLPLPAEGALLCRYPQPAPGPGSADPETRFLGPGPAELVRAAYLAGPSSERACDRPQPVVRYGVLLTDATGSRRAFTVDLGACATVRGPAGASGVAGAWLAEVLLVADRSTGFGTNLTQ